MSKTVTKIKTPVKASVKEGKTDKAKAPDKPPLSKRIEAFQRLVMAKSYKKAIENLRAIFATLESGNEGFGQTTIKVTPAAEIEATLLASSITNLLLDPGFALTRPALMVFSQHKRVMCQTFEVSGFRGTFHFMRLFGTPGENGSLHFQKQNVIKLFCALSLNAMTDQLFTLFLRQNPNVTWPLVNGFLSEQILWSQNAEKIRAKILASGKHWENIEATTGIVRNLGPAYMGCSYADAPHKHNIKTTMNAITRRWLLEQGIEDVPENTSGRRGVKRKPTLIVMAELYNSTHAMHRCYGPAIRSLKNRFKLIYMSMEGKCDKKLHDMFDKIDTTKFNATNPKAFFDKAKSYRPDVVYYPSVGMRMLSIMGSNLRLAPVQFMTYGHPATTKSPFVDYAVLVDGQIGSEDTVDETILYRPSTARWQRRFDAKDIKPKFNANPQVVRIAVPAWSRKVTPQFIATCQEIQKRAKRKTEFVFFPNGAGSLFQAFERRITSMLNAKCLPRTNYNSYIKNLNECDLFLSTFPFGATNGIIDAAVQGLPVVNMVGDEVHAANDSDIVAKFGQPDWLTTRSREDYITAVLRLIENGEERVKISRAIADFDHETGLFLASPSGCEAFALAVEAAYRHHETMQAEGKKSWKHDDLVRLTQGKA